MATELKMGSLHLKGWPATLALLGIISGIALVPTLVGLILSVFLK